MTVMCSTNELRRGDIVDAGGHPSTVLRVGPDALGDPQRRAVYLSRGVTIDCLASRRWTVVVGDDVRDVPARMDTVIARIRALLAAAAAFAVVASTTACTVEVYTDGHTSDHANDSHGDDVHVASDDAQDSAVGDGLPSGDEMDSAGASGGDADTEGGGDDSPGESGAGEDGAPSDGEGAPTGDDGSDDPDAGSTGTGGADTDGADGDGPSGGVDDDSDASLVDDLGPCLDLCQVSWENASLELCDSPVMGSNCNRHYCVEVAAGDLAACELQCYAAAGEDASADAERARVAKRASEIGRLCFERAGAVGTLEGQWCSYDEIDACTTEGCDGYWAGDACWYEAPTGESCAAECEVHGGYVHAYTFHYGSIPGVKFYPDYESTAFGDYGHECVDHVARHISGGSAIVGDPNLIVPGCASMCACTDVAP